MIGSAPARAVALAVRKFEILISEATWSEAQQVLSRSKFDRYQSPIAREEFLNALRGYLLPVNVKTQLDACRDKKDNKFLELAIDGGAQVILSGDKDLLVLHPFQGIDILSPLEFLARFES